MLVLSLPRCRESRYLSYTSLTVLHLNYYMLRNSVLLNIVRAVPESFRKLSIKYNETETANVIMDEVWMALKKKCPMVEVTMNINIKDIQTLLRIVTPAIPLVEIKIAFTTEWSEIRSKILFGHLTTNFSQDLKNIALDICVRQDDGLTTGLDNLIASCEKLSFLDLTTHYKDMQLKNVLDHVWNSLTLAHEQRKVVFSELSIDFHDLNQKKKKLLEEIKETFIERFRCIHVKCKLN